MFRLYHNFRKNVRNSPSHYIICKSKNILMVIAIIKYFVFLDCLSNYFKFLKLSLFIIIFVINNNKIKKIDK